MARKNLTDSTIRPRWVRQQGGRLDACLRAFGKVRPIQRRSVAHDQPSRGVPETDPSAIVGGNRGNCRIDLVEGDPLAGRHMGRHAPGAETDDPDVRGPARLR